MPSGGPRPGAGAPRGNLNAIKTGRHSRAHQRAVFIIAAVPELRQYLVALLRAYKRDQMRLVDNEISLGLAAMAESPALRKTIKNYVSKRLRSSSRRLQDLYFVTKEAGKTTIQSNRQLIEEIEDSLWEPPCPVPTCCEVISGPCRRAEWPSIISGSPR